MCPWGQLGALALASPTWAPPAHRGEGSHPLHPTAAGPEGLLGSVECLHPWEQEIQDCLGCSLMAEVLRMPQGKPAPVTPWHSSPEPS